MDDSTTEWRDYGNYLGYMFILSEDGEDILGPSEDNRRRHDLLELLAQLEIIEYHRGYDGLYYDIGIKKK